MTEALAVLFVAGVAAYAGLRNLLFSLRIKNKSEYLFFSFTCFACAAYNIFAFLLYQSTAYEHSYWYQRGQMSSAALMCIFFILFFQSLFKLFIQKPFIVLLILWAFFAIVAWLPLPGVVSLDARSLKDFHLGPVPIHILELTPGLLYNLFFVSVFMGLCMTIIYFRRVSVSRYKLLHKRVVMIIGIFSFAAIHDILLGMQLIHSIYLMEFAFLGVILLMDDHLVREFQFLLFHKEQQNLILERKVRERMSEIQDMAVELQSKNMALEHSNKTLQEMTEKDSLTGLLHHHSFMERLQEALNLSRRENLSLGVGMIDIDHFKEFNDHYGHLLGDEVLRIVTRILREHSPASDDSKSSYNKNARRTQLRNYDIVGRYGGDEFAMVIFHCDLVTAQSILERITSAIRATRLPQHPELRITLSLGLAIASRLPIGVNAAHVIEQADRALYEAKALGRDRFVVHTMES